MATGGERESVTGASAGVRALVAILRRHKTPLLTAFALIQLSALMFMPATRTAFVLLVRALINPTYGPYALLAPPLLAAGVAFNTRIKKLDKRWLEWSPFGIRANAALAPTRVRFVWLPYSLLLGACMPMLAFFEEIIFRRGTNSILIGILWGGIAFGALHLLSLVTVRMTIYLTLVGILFVGLYMQAGLLAVFVVHATYNMLALGLLVAEQHLGAGSAINRLASRVGAAT